MKLLKYFFQTISLVFISIVPGSGFVLQQRYKKALWFWVIFVLAFSLPAWLRLWGEVLGFLVSFVGVFALWLWHLYAVFFNTSSSNLKLSVSSCFKFVLYLSAFWILMVVALTQSRFLWGYQLFHIPSQSMEPTLLVGDYVLVDIWKYRKQTPQKQDIIVFKKPFNSNLIYNIKRVTHSQGDIFHQKILQKNKLAVMGDNRNDSEDSRVFGAITTDVVIGRAIWVVFSIDNMRNWRPARMGLLLDDVEY